MFEPLLTPEQLKAQINAEEFGPSPTPTPPGPACYCGYCGAYQATEDAIHASMEL